MDRAEFDLLCPSCSWHWVQSSLRVDHPFPVPWQIKKNPVAPSWCCFQVFPTYTGTVLSYFHMFRNRLEHFLKANLVANASAGSADMVVRPWLTWLWCFFFCVVVVLLLLLLFLPLLLLLLPFSFFPTRQNCTHFEFFLEPTLTKHCYLRCFVDIPAPSPDICSVLCRPSKNHGCLLPMQHAKTLLFTAFVCCDVCSTKLLLAKATKVALQSPKQTRKLHLVQVFLGTTSTKPRCLRCFLHAAVFYD